MLELRKIEENLKPEDIETVFQNKFITLRLVPSRWGPYVSIQSGTGKGAVLIVADTAGDELNVLMISQPRYALTTDAGEHNGFFTWEFPRGGHIKGESLMETAARELEEETNLKFPPQEIHYLGVAFTDSGILNTEVDYFYASVDTTAHPVVYNDNEILEHKWIPYSKILEAVRNGVIKDSYTLTALSKAIITGKLPAS